MKNYNRELLEGFDLINFLTSNGYSLEKVNGRTEYLLSSCPWCGKENHLGVQPDRQTFGCFRCKQFGSTLDLIIKISKKTYWEVVKLLSENVEVPVGDLSLIKDVVDKYSTMEIANKKPAPLPDGYVRLAGSRIPYLDTRNIRDDQVYYYHMGVCFSGRYSNRLIVCDVDNNDNVLYWIARDITGKAERKVLNPTVAGDTFGSGDILFNFHLARRYNICVITEGVFDALFVGNSAVATYGYGLKDHHLYWLLQANFDEVVICYDPDVSDHDLENTARILWPYFTTKICKLTAGDPDEHEFNQLWGLINEAKEYKGPLEKINV